MKRPTGWIIAGAGALVAAAVLTFVFWPRSMAIPEASVSPAPVETSAVPVPEQVQDLLDEHLKACAASTAAVAPEHCGISIPWGTEFGSVTGIRYRIEQMPHLTIDGEEFTASDGVLVATVTGTGHDGAARTETYQSANWAVRGDVHVAGDTATITVW